MLESFKRKRVLDDFAEFVSPHKVRFYRRFGVDIVMGKREGIYFHDLSGKRFINCHSNGGVFNLGHRNPEVLAAVLEAAEFYDIGNHHLISGPRSLLARKLAESFRPGFLSGLWSDHPDSVVFAAGGGEAVDTAIKVARGFTGRTKVVSVVGGYHGHTGLALAAGESRYREPFHTRIPDFIQTPFGHWQELYRALDDDTAAVILETIPATLGMTVFPEGVLSRVRRICDRRGIVLILDEIQTGLGRTGRTWGFQHFGIMPDMVVVGKGLSGGIYPIAALCMKKRFQSVFRKDPFIHISTFGGSELGCFAALKVLEFATDARFLEEVRRRGQFLKTELEGLAAERPEIVEVRGMGMFLGVVFRDSATCLVFVRALFRNGIYAVYANNDKRVLQFLPPLITTEAQAEEIIAAFRQALADLDRIGYRVLRRVVGFLSDDES